MRTRNRAVAVFAMTMLLGCLQAPQAFLGHRASARDVAHVRASSPPAFSQHALGMRFVEIPGGSFAMGSTIGPGEAPVHRVAVPSFWMAVTEVTQAQWQTVMGSNPSHFTQAGPNAPVEMVSWEDVQTFIGKLNALEPEWRYRLPSEAEWEYACRGSVTKDPYGPPEAIGWINENSGGATHPVGQKRPNGFGLYDMLGNVSEWTEDTYHPDYNGAPTDGSAWKSEGARQHTLRGGGWDLPARFIHAALRGPYDPIHRLGFRLVCVPVAPAVRRQGAKQNPAAAQPRARDFARHAGPYLGQSPSGSQPQVFAPNAVSTSAHELNSVFTPDGKEFYFTIQGDDGRWTIMRTALENGRWTAAQPATFSGRWSDVDLFITLDGRQLYFCSNRPLEGDTPKDFDIWVCERSDGGWSEPRNLGAPINSPFAEFYPTLTTDGTMYFQSRRPGGQGGADIWRARLRDGRYVEAECLPPPVNTSGFEGDAFIAPDERYLIVSTRVEAGAPPPAALRLKADGGSTVPPPPTPAPGLFLTRRSADGTWSPLVSLGDAINLPTAGVNCEMLSPDGRYLFFTRGGDIYWVSSTVIEDAERRALLSSSVAPALQADARVRLESLAGKYEGKATSAQGEEAITANLQVAGGKLTGTLNSGDGPIAITGATITGERVVFALDMGGSPGRITAVAKDGRLEGEWALAGMSGRIVLTRTGEATAATVGAPTTRPSSFTHPRLQVAVPDFPAEGLILDIGGGGEGVIGQLKGQQVVAIDLSKRELDEAPGQPLLKIVMDARDLKFVDGTFRTATVFFTFMYIDPADHEKVFREIHRVLAPGGRLLVWDPIFPDTRDPAHVNILFPLHVKLPQKEIDTGYGVRFREGQACNHFVGLAQEAGFQVVSQKNEAGWFFLELKKP